jgi:hypothetical protein
MADNTLWVCCTSKITGFIEEMLAVSFRIREDIGKKFFPNITNQPKTIITWR